MFSFVYVVYVWERWFFFFEGYGDHRDLHVLTHAFPTRRSSDLIDLVDARQIDFRRILGGRDIDVVGVENVQTGIQRHGFARTGRPGDQDHALWLRQRLHVRVFLLGLVAERIDAKLSARRIEDAAADLFAEQRRTGADAKIDCLGLGDVQLDTTILRHAALSQIKARHHLDASRETPRHRLWRGRDRLQLAILAVADTIGFLVRFEMHVRCADVDRIDQHLVDVAYDRRIVSVGLADIDIGICFATFDFEILEVGIAEIHALRFAGLNRGLDRLDQLVFLDQHRLRSEEHTSELQSLMRISYA